MNADVDPYIFAGDDPVQHNQSKGVNAAGELCYTADGSRVFPGANGIRTVETARADGAPWAQPRRCLNEAAHKLHR